MDIFARTLFFSWYANANLPRPSSSSPSCISTLFYDSFRAPDRMCRERDEENVSWLSSSWNKQRNHGVKFQTRKLYFCAPVKREISVALLRVHFSVIHMSLSFTYETECVFFFHICEDIPDLFLTRLSRRLFSRSCFTFQCRKHTALTFNTPGTRIASSAFIGEIPTNKKSFPLFSWLCYFWTSRFRKEAASESERKKMRFSCMCSDKKHNYSFALNFSSLSFLRFFVTLVCNVVKPQSKTALPLSVFQAFFFYSLCL